VDGPRFRTTLFSTPKLALTTPDYMIGLYASALIRDGGTLQIGIGALGDAIVYATQLRHQQNNAYRRALSTIGALDNHQALIDEIGGEAPFAKGLYGATEMFVDGFLHLYRAGILKRRVYDFWALQQLINEGRCDPDDLRADVLDALESLGVRVIRSHDFAILQHHGFFNDATRYDQGYLVAPDGERVIANVADAAARRVIAAKCLGKKLQRGYLLHGGFFLGPRDFYEALGAMSGDERAQICMTGVAKINQLDHNPRLYKQQRKDARFVNTGIMATLSGGIVSDGLEDGRVISGVGGQNNFVAMAHHYAHSTIPRHLRDIVITEYGIADLRSKTDGEIIQALLNVADSRFQQSLFDEAKRHGKIARDYAIAERFRHNTPQRLEASLQQFRSQGLFPAFPLGCDFTAEELALGKALRGMKARVAKTKKWRLALAAWRFKDDPLSARPYLRRMKLESPKSFEDKVARMLLIEQ